MEQEEVLFRRMPSPGMDLVDHANRIGIRLKSSNMLPMSRGMHSRLSNHSSPSRATSRNVSHTPLSSRTRASPHRVMPPNTPPVQYIQNIVVPLHAPTDEMNLASTAKSQAFSGSRVHSNTGTRRGKSPNLMSAGSVTIRNSAIRSYTSQSTPCVHHNTVTMHTDTGSMSHDGSNRWNRSEQAMRYITEQESITRSRNRKRTSETCSPAGYTNSDDPNEIRPHRVDRTYYMSGSNLSLRHKYKVDDAELNQLKEMANTRRQAKHYGQGLSRQHDELNCKTVLHNSEVPRQPPPSSMGDTEMGADGLLADDAVINDTHTVGSNDNDEAHQMMPHEDEGIGMDTPLSPDDVELADAKGLSIMKQSGPSCDSYNDRDDNREVGKESELGLHSDDKEDEQEKNKEESLETQYDLASGHSLNPNRKTGSTLTMSGTDTVTARSETWKGALLEAEYSEPDIGQSQDTHQGNDNADLRMDQSGEADQTNDLKMDQSPATHAEPPYGGEVDELATSGVSIEEPMVDYCNYGDTTERPQALATRSGSDTP